jgi:UDP-N-acetylglucosamine acyltransferase
MTGALIDPNFTLGDNVIIGHGSVLSGHGRISANVVIGHHVIIEGDVDIGEGTKIGHHSVLRGPLRIGPRNELYPFVSLGFRAQHPDYHGEGGPVIIGQENVLREFTSINASTFEPETVLGDRNYLMAYSHVSHDCRIGNGNKFAMHATLAGHVEIGDNCYLGMHVVLHQRVKIGHLCMIGMNEAIKRHVPPFALITDKRFAKMNVKGLVLRGVSQDEISNIERRYQHGISDDTPSAYQKTIDEFYAKLLEGGSYQYEKAKSA